jgi:hypothetical protein
MILDRCAAQGQPVLRLQNPRRLGGHTRSVLDCLRFVEHDIVEWHFGQFRSVAAQGAVGGQHQIVVPE